MDSIKRIYRACRAAIAELDLNTYFMSTGILLVCIVMIFFSKGDSDRYQGVLGNSYLDFDAKLIGSLIVGVGWLAATIISGTIVNKYFKEENRAVRYLSLPLSNGERFSVMLLVNWLFASVVSFLPLVLIFIILYYVRPDSVFMAPPFENLHWYLIGPLMHLATLAFWLFPTVAYAKKAGYAIVGIILAFGFYLTSTRGDHSDFVDLAHNPTAFEATDVVGLSKYGFLNEQVTEVAFGVPDPESFQILFLAIVVALMMLAAYIAFTRKTA